jgi:DNA-binding HxlR family transcriptional regulator
MKQSEVLTMINQTKWCPIDAAVQVLGKKFTIHILRNMILLEQTRFNQMIETIEGINTKTLSIRLKEMEEIGLITRTEYKETPPRVEYAVTEKGRAVESLLEQMAAFSMYFYPDMVFEDGKPRTFKEFFGRYSMRMK